MERLIERVERLVGARPVSWEPRNAPWQPADAVEGGNERFSVLLDDGRRVFVKAAQAEHTAGWLRREHEVYAHLRGSFMPELVAFEDDPIYPVLVLEDLSDADWGTHWDPRRVELVRAAFAELAASEPPPNTRPVRETFSHLFGRWRLVEQDPEPFLSTGIRSREWLEHALPTLIAAADEVPADGDDLLHLDVRSDNLCTRGDAALFVDWNWCSTGNARSRRRSLVAEPRARGRPAAVGGAAGRGGVRGVPRRLLGGRRRAAAARDGADPAPVAAHPARGRARVVGARARALTRAPRIERMATTGVREFQNFIGGEWVDAASGETFESTSPADGETIGVFPKSGAEDVDRAVAAAKEAYEDWRLVPAPKRGEILFRFAQLLVERRRTR